MADDTSATHYFGGAVPKVRGTCKQCGNPIEFYPSQARQYCSQSCRSKWVAQSGMPLKPRTGRYIPCERCGTDLWVMKSEEGKRRFCSKSCHDAAQTKTPVVKTCAVCSKQFTLKPSQAVWRGGERVYCSRDCMGLAHTKRPLDRMHNGKPARLDGDGYVWVWAPDHAESKRYRGWIAEHRLVAEQHLGRELTSADEVHHVNRIKDDNRPENLQVLDGVTHAVITAQQRLSDRELVAEYLKRFGPLNI